MYIFRRHICEIIAWDIILDISCEQNTLTKNILSNCNYNLYAKVKNEKYQTKGFVFTHWWIPNKRTWTILSGCFISCFLPKEDVKEIRLRSLIFECREWDQLPSEFILRDLEDGTSNLYQINISIEIEMNPVSIYQYFMTTFQYRKSVCDISNLILLGCNFVHIFLSINCTKLARVCSKHDMQLSATSYKTNFDSNRLRKKFVVLRK